MAKLKDSTRLKRLSLHEIAVINGYIVFHNSEYGYMACPVNKTIQARTHPELTFSNCLKLVKGADA